MYGRWLAGHVQHWTMPVKQRIWCLSCTLFSWHSSGALQLGMCLLGVQHTAYSKTLHKGSSSACFPICFWLSCRCSVNYTFKKQHGHVGMWGQTAVAPVVLQVPTCLQLMPGALTAWWVPLFSLSLHAMLKPSAQPSRSDAAHIYAL